MLSVWLSIRLSLIFYCWKIFERSECSHRFERKRMLALSSRFSGVLLSRATQCIWDSKFDSKLQVVRWDRLHKLNISSAGHRRPDGLADGQMHVERIGTDLYRLYYIQCKVFGKVKCTSHVLHSMQAWLERQSHITAPHQSAGLRSLHSPAVIAFVLFFCVTVARWERERGRERDRPTF